MAKITRSFDEAMGLIPSRLFSVLLLLALTGCTPHYDLIRTEAAQLKVKVKRNE